MGIRMRLRGSPEAIARWNEDVLSARAVAAGRCLSNGNDILLKNVFLFDASAIEDLAPGGPCPFLGQEACLSVQGSFDPCSTPDAAGRTLGDFGDPNEQGFMEMWGGDEGRELTAIYRRRLRLGCNMRRPAGGFA